MTTLSARCQTCLHALEETHRLLDLYSDLDVTVSDEVCLKEAMENLTTLLALLYGANAVLSRYLQDY